LAQLGPGRVERRSPVALAADALFPFTCQGCGAFCCTNERLVLSPLELRTLVVAVGIDATDLSARGWLAAFPDPESGIPRVMVDFLPVKPDLTACPFLGIEAAVPLSVDTTPETRLNTLERHQAAARVALAEAGDDGGRSLPLRCQAYSGRPIMCRSFPLQFKLELHSNGQPTGWSALAHTRCPGHGLGSATQTAGEYLAASGIAPLAAARLDWHRLNLAIAGAGVTLRDHETASGSRRALWDTTLNLLFASYASPRLQVSDARYIPTITGLFQQHLTPVARLIDAEVRARAGTLSQGEAAGQLRTLVAACRQLEEDLDQPTANPVTLTWPAPVAFA
jgi:Fe-S-cluster containining protein